jgi:hypothetical protein
VTIATLVVVGVLAISAWAVPKELGLEPSNKPQPDCPAEPCRATGKMSGFQVQQLKQSDGKTVTKFPTRVTGRNSWLVAFSLTMGAPNAEQRQFFNQLWGKPAEARISVFEPTPSQGDRKNKKQRYTLHNQSAVFDVRSWFGKKAWFVPKKRIHVEKGSVIGLTLPTWAPVLATDLRKRERWRSSRKPDHCDELERDRARENIGEITKFQCLHSTARILFTALIVPKTPENKNR